MKDTQPYYDRATSWALDTQAIDSRSRRTAWTFAGIAAAAALFEAVALAMLAPLKTVQTVTLLVDKQTGYVQAVDPAQPRRILADDALTNAFLAQYVIAREGFDRATVAGDYRKVALWSAGRARASYVAAMPAANPASPFQRLPVGTTLETAIKSVSRLGPGVALVRFDTAGMDRDGQRSALQPWVAVVRFRYIDATMRMEDRLINPLGFQVTGYRRDPEAPPPIANASPPPLPVSVADTPLPVIAEPSRRARRSPTRSQPPFLPPVRAAPALSGPREVPLNQLPMGSPLSPGGAAIRSPQ